MNNSKQIKKIIGDCIKWLEEVQIKDDLFHKGGFPPYPDTIKSAGTLATADVITFLQRTGIKKKQLIDDGVEFLLRVQIKDNKKYLSQNGGFPPIGDFEFIVNTSFTDSTADALLGLLNSYRQIKDKNKLEIISNSIERGINWLLECYNSVESLPFPTYLIKEEYNVGQQRYFPTILSGIAFITYIDYCKIINKEVRDEIEIKKCVKDIAKCIKYELGRKGYMVFLKDKDVPSLTSTILAIEFIHILKKSTSVEGCPNWDSVLEKSYKWLLEQYKNRLSKDNENNDTFTDYDFVHIDIPEISEGDYPATYFTPAPMVKLLVEYPPSSEYKELLDNLIQKLIKIVEYSNDTAYYLEYRGRDEPATSATAAAICALNSYEEVI